MICQIESKPTGHIYFIRHEGSAIRIGYAENVSRRMDDHRRNYGKSTIEFLFSVKGCRLREKAFHSLMRAHRLPRLCEYAEVAPGHFIPKRMAGNGPEWFSIPEEEILSLEEKLSHEEGFCKNERPHAFSKKSLFVKDDLDDRVRKLQRKFRCSFQEFATKALDHYASALEQK